MEKEKQSIRATAHPFLETAWPTIERVYDTDNVDLAIWTTNQLWLLLGNLRGRVVAHRADVEDGAGWIKEIDRARLDAQNVQNALRRMK